MPLKSPTKKFFQVMLNCHTTEFSIINKRKDCTFYSLIQIIYIVAHVSRKEVSSAQIPEQRRYLPAHTVIYEYLLLHISFITQPVMSS